MGFVLPEDAIVESSSRGYVLPEDAAPSSSPGYVLPEGESSSIDPSQFYERGASTGELMGLAKGALKGSLSPFTLPADLLYRGGNKLLDYLSGQETPLEGGYPSDRVSQLANYLQGNKIQSDPLSESIGEVATTVPLSLAAPSLVTKVASSVPATSSALTKALLTSLAGGAEGAGYSIMGRAKEEDPFANVGTGAAIGAAIPALFSAPSLLSPTKSAQTTASQVSSELDSILPGTLSSGISEDQRVLEAVKGIGKSYAKEKKAAGKLFEALPENTIELESAIQKAEETLAERGGPIQPGSAVYKILDDMKTTRVPSQTIVSPASSIVDELGVPLREATSTTIPGKGAEVPLNQLQNYLRDIGRAIRKSSSDVEKGILVELEKNLLNATKAGEGALPTAISKSLEEARAAWRSLSEKYREGAGGKAIKILTNKGADLKGFTRTLLKDARSTEQLTKLMTPSEVENVKQLAMADIITRPPSSWEKAIGDRKASFDILFGQDKTSRLLDMVSKNGTIGKKLLQDDKLIGAFLGKALPRMVAAGGVTAFAGSGPIGWAATAAVGAHSLKEAKAVDIARSLIYRAAIADPAIVRLLNKPVNTTPWNSTLDKLQELLVKSPLFMELAAKEPPKKNFIIRAIDRAEEANQ